jgi:hypothetical protein
MFQVGGLLCSMDTWNAVDDFNIDSMICRNDLNGSNRTPYSKIRALSNRFSNRFSNDKRKKIYDCTIRMNKLDEFRVNCLIIFFSNQAYDLTSDIWGTNSQP